MQLQRSLELRTEGRGIYELTDRVSEVVRAAGVREGLCVVSCLHTSASLVVTECADPAVRTDLQAWLERIAPEGDASYTHTAEGPDDMPAHLRAAITSASETLIISAGELALGVWQGLYLMEHRAAPHSRRVLVHVQGDL
ncbi:MAG: secondary thiamine-phosphate synthase enzyme YjbQ [Planctomycetes bacterium]|nr:secondary thiamine-phosphate synthase enzyme YjbQ [Planctomycetota bacterium]